jgi:hypothetical protein
MGLSLDQQRLDSVVGLSQDVNVRFKNPFPFPVLGRIDLVAPEIFAEGTESAPFEVGPKTSEVIPVRVLLRPDTSAQDSLVQVVVQTFGSPPRKFAVTKSLPIGNDDVSIDTRYRISESDELLFEVEASNKTGQPVSFDCLLLIPDRTRERIQLNRVVETATRMVSIPKGSELIGETLWLRCEQIGSRRVLNYRIRIEPPQENAGRN